MAQMAPQMAASYRFTEKAAASRQSRLGMKQKCCIQNLQLGQHPIDGADGTIDGAKLQNYRISCCKQPKQFGDEAESVVEAICSWDSITATYRWCQVI